MKKYPVFKTIRRVASEVILRDKKILTLFLFFSVITSIYPIFAVYIPKIVIGGLTEPSINFEFIIYAIAAFTLFTALLSFIGTVIENISNPRIVTVRIGLITELFDKLNNIDYRYREDPKFLDNNEDALQAVSSSDMGYEGMMKRMFHLGAKTLTIIFYLIIILQLSYLVLIALVISLAVSISISVFVERLRYRSKDKLAHANRKIRYFEKTTHDFSYGKDIRLYGFQDKIKCSYDYEIKSYISVYRKIKNKEYLLGFIDLLFVLISDIVLYYILITQVINNGLSIADFSMYLVATIALSTLLKTAGEDFVYIVGQGQYVNDYYNFLEKKLDAPTGNLPHVKNDTLDIEFKNVSFKYPGTDKWIIKNLDLKINKKEKLAIVGINGAGKTTLVKLMTRLFDPTEGEILINGRNALEYDKQEYQKMFAPVFQDINILAFSIRENITLGQSNDEIRIWDCLDRVGLGDKVRGLEKGLDQMMLKIIEDDGVIFSGGESQKLVIARALYKNANAVILDEPTAALDALAESDIYQSFNNLVEHKTAIYISHRLASTKFCDKIALFKDSELLEYGNHNELMMKKGEFYNMFVVQGKYYQEESKHEEL